MKKTALYDIHRASGARMIEFAGYEMPVEYSGVNDEHMTVREKAGLFDVSHMGEIWVKGPNARNFVQRVTTNDIDRLVPGKVHYSCFPNGEGGIVDDLLIYKYDDQKYMLVVNAANVEKDWNWLNEQNEEIADLENASEEISQLALQGPRAYEILQTLTDFDLASLKFYTFTTDYVAGAKDVIISNTGYTGSGGYELYFYNEYATKLWEAIMEAGEKFGLKPVGLAARDTLRLEMGMCLYGNDINEHTSPIEAGLGWITRFTENNEFIDKDLFLKQKEEGVNKRLIGFKMIDKGIPRQHYKIKSLHGEEIGEVTSGTMSPLLKKGIGMGYVNPVFANEGTELLILIRNKELRAKVVKPPFIPK